MPRTTWVFAILALFVLGGCDGGSGTPVDGGVDVEQDGGGDGGLDGGLDRDRGGDGAADGWDGGDSDDGGGDGEPASLEVQSWVRDAQHNPVLVAPGGAVLQVSDPSAMFDANQFKLWFAYVGQQGSVPSLGFATSQHGDDFTVITAPSLAPANPGAWDDQIVDIPSVVRAETDPDRLFKMYYGGSNAGAPHLYRIGLATSLDGQTDWQRLPAGASIDDMAGLILKPGETGPGDVAAVLEPAVVLRNGTYHMWYNSYGVDQLVVSYATSSDGITWHKHPQNPVLVPDPSSWENGHMPGFTDGTIGQPWVLWNAERNLFFMWFGVFNNTGHAIYTGIGSAWSADGINWTKHDGPVLEPCRSCSGEELGISSGPTVIEVDGVFHLYYTGLDKQGLRVINHATLEPGL